jgi:adenosylmethionine-8-amino-7-oxononanoate aminotransferase
MSAPLDRLLERDRRVVWHPFTQAATAGEPLQVIGADGPDLVLADGQRVLDGISSWWTVLHGHGEPRLVRAIAEQAARLDHVLFAGATHPGAVELAERLVARAPSGLSRVFFSDDGSTAVEVALKLAFQFFANLGRPEKRGFAAFVHGYHGDTVGAMSVGDPADFSFPFVPILIPVERLPTAPCEGWPLTAQDGAAVEAALAALAALLERKGHELAAVILEPMVQGAGGMVMHSPAFLRGVAELCRAHDVLFVADEVMTGFGRTGRLFAVEHAGVSPDLLCLAKGLTGGVLPLAATLASERIFEAFLSRDARRTFLHGHSFTANPIACAAALASLELFEERGVLERVAAIEALHARCLGELAAHPRVRSVRWLGAIGALELVGDDASYFGSRDSERIARRLLAAGVLVRPLGPVLYLLAPLATPLERLDRAWALIFEALDAEA